MNRYHRLAFAAIFASGLAACSGGVQPAIPGTGAPHAGAKPSTSLPFSDQFAGRALNPGWIVSNPNPDSRIGLTRHGWLDEVASPLNGGSDLCSCSNYNAPNILQPIDPSLNYTFGVEMGFSATNNWQAAGILLATQPGNFTADTQFARIAEIDSDGVDPQGACFYAFSSQTRCVNFASTTAYFQLSKNGSRYTLRVSPDRINWTSLGSLQIATAYSYIGLFSDRQPYDENDKIYSSAEFNYFNIRVH